MQKRNAGPMHLGGALAKCSTCTRMYDVSQMSKNKDDRYVCPPCVAAGKLGPKVEVNTWTGQSVERAKDV